MPSATYTTQNSSQTLRQALDEYYALNPSLLSPADMPEAAGVMFKRHDAGHIVFGCDTSLRGETLIDTWTICRSTTGVRGYLEYFNYPQVNAIFREVGFVAISVEFLRCIPEVCRIIYSGLRRKPKWPWYDYESFLDKPLQEIRDQFQIQVL